MSPGTLIRWPVTGSTPVAPTLRWYRSPQTGRLGIKATAWTCSSIWIEHPGRVDLVHQVALATKGRLEVQILLGPRPALSLCVQLVAKTTDTVLRYLATVEWILIGQVPGGGGGLRQRGAGTKVPANQACPWAVYHRIVGACETDDPTGGLSHNQIGGCTRSGQTGDRRNHLVHYLTPPEQGIPVHRGPTWVPIPPSPRKSSRR